jgi:hypothetical protein
LSTDFSFFFTDGLVLVKLGLRLLESLGLSFVVGWLTIRTGSVIPAGVAHGLFNILGFSPFGPRFPGIGPLIDLSWGMAAYALFRYWPRQTRSLKATNAADPVKLEPEP